MAPVFINELVGTSQQVWFPTDPETERVSEPSPVLVGGGDPSGRGTGFPPDIQ